MKREVKKPRPTIARFFRYKNFLTIIHRRRSEYSQAWCEQLFYHHYSGDYRNTSQMEFFCGKAAISDGDLKPLAPTTYMQTIFSIYCNNSRLFSWLRRNGSTNIYSWLFIIYSSLRRRYYRRLVYTTQVNSAFVRIDWLARRWLFTSEQPNKNKVASRFK